MIELNLNLVLGTRMKFVLILLMTLSLQAVEFSKPCGEYFVLAQEHINKAESVGAGTRGGALTSHATTWLKMYELCINQKSELVDTIQDTQSDIAKLYDKLDDIEIFLKHNRPTNPQSSGKIDDKYGTGY